MSLDVLYSFHLLSRGFRLRARGLWGLGSDSMPRILSKLALVVVLGLATSAGAQPNCPVVRPLLAWAFSSSSIPTCTRPTVMWSIRIKKGMRLMLGIARLQTPTARQSWTSRNARINSLRPPGRTRQRGASTCKHTSSASRPPVATVGAFDECETGTTRNHHDYMLSDGCACVSACAWSKTHSLTIQRGYLKVRPLSLFLARSLARSRSLPPSLPPSLLSLSLSARVRQLGTRSHAADWVFSMRQSIAARTPTLQRPWRL
jgi:hypothetical protein